MFSTLWNAFTPHPKGPTKQLPPASLNAIAAHTEDPTVKAFAACYDDNCTPRDTVIDSLPTIESYRAPKYPIVLCHGLSGFDRLILIPSLRNLINLILQHIHSNNADHFMDKEESAEQPGGDLVTVDYWIGIRELLEKNGCTVLTARVPSFGSIEERAAALHGILKRKTAEQLGSTRDPPTEKHPARVNLIAHSMGGLDARYLISRIPSSEKNYEVVSLTAISTPHQGSEMADFVVENFQLMKTLLAKKQPVLPICFYQLTTNYMRHFFNLVTPDDPAVHYFSYGSNFTPKWYSVFNMSWQVIYERSGGQDNDGMVTVQSAHWGEYMGTLHNMDHLDVINWQNKLIRNNGLAQAGPLQHPPIDILQFYLTITHNLAQRGF
ncbi:triglyceride lipase KNAG_0A07210 [Huiozyma naganishii CBS 8797]|uniref:DUF676 domain-containing protein n=1 Tax=Huiozyma naganishii (strain ATCC MYA-139 / BCRC 22969 / CBS 8797 / KCTC 17520 / NBRC 10181 / NCYC 3082 / Yp74L-3) TaxID=1071383 RepID=J7S2V9_HUIN7|nr:hypothetical protein KNAG_0A07210 [Kazachstania naganishii CBS 8797]CCK68374.1 hypothetical protein KNAG_0A07210 [Kazachstania naganishii CBS 8797]